MTIHFLNCIIKRPHFPRAVGGVTCLLVETTLSVDHRISDGAEAAQFIQAPAGLLENPVRLLV
jgi:pyruvate/2-oxoglutarate dehydrogenase complex dihydrolipoamide acyltransferase (E2) component